MGHEIDSMPDDVVYQVCVLVLRETWTMTAATRWLQENGYPRATREWPRKILVAATQRGLLSLAGRENLELAMRIQRNSGVSCRVAEVKDGGRAAFEAVAKLAADQALYLIRQVQTDGREIEPPDNEVHIGLAAGGTSGAFTARLAKKLEGKQKLPELCLHTLTTGFFVDNPDSAPVVALGQFSRIEPRPRYVVLFSEPLVSRSEAKSLPKRPFLREAFEGAEELDIVVTSVSVAGHEHSVFRHAIEQDDEALYEKRIADLEKKGWQGDIMWQPYSANGHPIDAEVRAVTVVDFKRLVALANTPGRHVVCIAGPCAECGDDKARAVVPLLRCPQSRRPFSHLITTEVTARKICEELGW